MLQDGELDGLEARLNAYRIENARANFSLEELLSRYEKLIDEYRTLKAFQDDQTNATQPSLGNGSSAGNSFVLVLIDGNTMIFNDDLIKARQDGGIRAANLLMGAVRTSLAGTGLETATIVLRVYADLAGLSKSLSRAHLVGPERRSLAPFTAAFSSTNELFDFIDAGEDVASTKGKIREALRLFAESKQCKHIIFAGCRDTEYLQMLLPYRNNPTKMTLIRSHSDGPQFAKLGLRFDSYPSVFRMAPLETQAGFDEGPPGLGPKQAHSPSPYSSGPQFSGMRSAERKPGHYRASYANKGPYKPAMSAEKSYFAVYSENAGKVPINEAGLRLDPYIPKCSSEDWNNFSERCAGQKLCNDHHLKGVCPRGDNCPFSHGEAAPELINVLRYVARSIPCPRRGECRDASCYMAHVCMKPGCMGPGKGCRLNRAMHGIDGRLAAWVTPNDGAGGTTVDGMSGDQSSMTSPRSFTDQGTSLDLAQDSFDHDGEVAPGTGAPAWDGADTGGWGGSEMQRGESSSDWRRSPAHAENVHW